MEEEALKRRQRLQELRNRQAASGEDKSAESVDKETLPKPVFRSYRPQDETLKQNVLPDVKPPDEMIAETVRIVSSEVVGAQPTSLTNLKSKKPDLDLKRNINDRLEYLNRKTKKAIADLVRERLRTEKDLASIGSATATIQ